MGTTSEYEHKAEAAYMAWDPLWSAAVCLTGTPRMSCRTRHGCLVYFAQNSLYDSLLGRGSCGMSTGRRRAFIAALMAASVFAAAAIYAVVHYHSGSSITPSSVTEELVRQGYTHVDGDMPLRSGDAATHVLLNGPDGRQYCRVAIVGGSGARDQPLLVRVTCPG
jgi:hypothetical protein